MPTAETRTRQHPTATPTHRPYTRNSDLAAPNPYVARMYSCGYVHTHSAPALHNQLLIRLPSALNVAPSLSSTMVTALFSGPWRTTKEGEQDRGASDSTRERDKAKMIEKDRQEHRGGPAAVRTLSLATGNRLKSDGSAGKEEEEEEEQAEDGGWEEGE
jgi:hypothetical protein